MESNETMKVTPWEVSGRIDYEKLVKDFGTSVISNQLLKRIEKKTGELHFMLRRGLFFSHRDLDWALDKLDKGEKFVLYTGRGPSGDTHLGHLMPWVFTKWLQDKFDTELYFQITDDEKFLFKDGLELNETNRLAYENALDVIALGFDPKKTFMFVDTDYSGTLYPEAIKVAKRLTFSTAKAVFGFQNESNVGEIFFTSMQSVPAFLPSILKKKNVPVLIPHAIDQDPHFRITRDIIPKLGYYKPASIHCTFMPGLKGVDSKMSASIPDSAIFTTDPPEIARRKIMKAFSGGADTLEEHRKHGGNPDVDIACIYLKTLFEPDDKKLAYIISGFRSGSLTSGDVKGILADKVEKFLKGHQKAREAAKKKLDKFFLHDVPKRK